MPIGELARQDEYGDELLPPLVDPRGTLGTAAGRGLAEALKHSAATVMFPGKYAAGGNPYPPGSEEAQFLEDSRERSATDWGRKFGTAMVADPVPAGLALLRGQSLRGTMGSVGAGAGQGIRAYHSSPYDFEKFDFSKIGTGEGAQVYGHGGYFADNPAVSGQGGEYWKSFLQRFEGNERKAADFLQRAGFDRDAALKMIADDKKRSAYLPSFEPVETLLKSGKPVGPRTYEVNIKAKPEEMLDWDKPIKEQPASIRQAVQRLVPDLSEQFPGSHFYARGAAATGGRDKASMALREAGISGIRYLDQGSRRMSDAEIRSAIARNHADIEYLKKTGGERDAIGDLEHRNELFVEQLKTPQTSNYVMFPGTEHLIDITKKYAVPAGALGSLASQDQYQ